MDKNSWKKIKQLFNQCIDMDSEQVDRYLSENTRGEDEIYHQVKQMLEIDSTQSSAITQSVSSTVQNYVSQQFSLQQGDHIGAYEIISKIGEGGMGTVFLAHRNDDSFTQHVAIKIIHSTSINTETLQRFQNERQILANLNHPNIARLLDGGATESGLPYLVMEYVEGLPIVEYCQSRQLNLIHRIKLFLQVCEAIKYAHQNLIVHRDIKPANILVSEEGQIKLLDFGIAKILQPENFTHAISETQSEIRMLTPENASPEQILGEAVTTRTDVYSLGNLLYQLLTEQKLFDFDKENRLTMERLICEQTPLKPSNNINSNFSLLQHKPGTQKTIVKISLDSLKKNLQGDLDIIILKALQKDPDRRYQSVEQLSDDIQRHLDNFPIQARGDSIYYRARKFFQRNTMLVSMASLFGVSLVIFIIVLLLQSKALEAQKLRAVFEAENAKIISDFMIDIFDSSDPNNNSGENLNASELLDNAKQKINQLQDKPGLQAAMLQAIGRVYMKLGKYDQALQLIERSVVLTDNANDLTPQQLAESYSIRADLQFELGNYDQTEAFYLQALEILQSQEEKDEDEITSNQLGLVAVLTELQRNEEALPIQQKILQRQLHKYGPDSREVGEAYTFMGNVLRRLGRYQEAESALLKALSNKRISYGTMHLETAHTLNQLARTQTFLKKYDEALAFAREGLTIRQKIHQSDNPEIAASLGNISHILTAAKRFDEAIDYRQASLKVLIKLFGDTHPYIAGTYGSLGSLLSEKGDYVAAKEAFTHSIEQFRNIYKEPNIKLATSLAGLGKLYLEQNQPQQAMPLLQESYDIRSQKLDPDNWRIASSLALLAQCNMDLNLNRQAETQLIEALRIFKKTLDKNDSKIKEVKNQLVKLYKQEQNQEKVKLYQN